MIGIIDPLDTAPGPEEATATPTAATDAATLESVRSLVMQAHREIVPELVHGESLTELLASIEPARQAYAGLVQRFQANEPATGSGPALPAVPAGGTGPAPLDLDRIPPTEKLRRGIRDRAHRTLR